MAEGEIDNLTMEQYLALSRGNHAPGVVKPEIEGNVNFEIKSQFMRELREDTFSENKNDDAHEHEEPLSKGIAHRPKPLSNLKKSETSSKKVTKHYTKLGNGAYLDKDCPLSEEVKSIKKAKYGEFGPSQSFGNRSKYRVGPPGYYTCVDNRPPFREKRPSLEELINKHLEESSRRRAEMEELVKKLQENAEINTRNQTGEVNSSPDQCKSVYTNKEAPLNNASPKVSFVCTKYSQNKGTSSRVLPCQLPPKESNPGNFTLSCTIGILNFYAIADLGASVNVIPKSMFEHLKLAGLTNTDMLVEMADTTKRTPIGIVENVLVKDHKYFIPLRDILVMRYALNTRNETKISGKALPTTIHPEYMSLNKEISLGIRRRIGDSLSFPDILLVKYGETQEKELIWDDRFEEWRNNNPSPDTPTSRFTTVQENLNPKPKDYPFKDWLLTKVGHTDVSEPVKKTLLKKWLLDCFKKELIKDPRSRSFDDYKWMFNLEIYQLADKYELGIGKKGHMLDDIWENCKKVQGDNTCWWHDKKSEEEERRQRLNTTEKLMDALPLGIENGSRFRDMNPKEETV
ncbi:DNA-binding pseudobarrel domain-containing protein [Tanacetum coccineum]